MLDSLYVIENVFVPFSVIDGELPVCNREYRCGFRVIYVELPVCQ